MPSARLVPACAALPLGALLLTAHARAEEPAPTTEIALVGFSDYHAHAVPFDSEGRAGQGGLARLVAFLREARQRPHTLVVSGGDFFNRGTPVWSDELRCAEWPLLRGLVDAVALGNHDLDYGAAELERCAHEAAFTLLCANLIAADGPVYAVDGKPYLVRQLAGVKLGLFAVAGPDVPTLVREADLPPGASWADNVATTRAVVRRLREVEGVDAVVLIGHVGDEDAAALAAEVPGIDVVLGSHAHTKADLHTLRGTHTVSASPYQYGAYVVDLSLRFEGRRLAEVAGGLVRLDESRPQDPEAAAEVARLQAELERRRPERFAVIGRALVALDDTGVRAGESVIGNWVTEVARQAAGVHVFFSTASSFRGGLAAGPLTREALYAALPYPNRIATVELKGRQLLDWLALSLARRGSDAFSQQTGLRYRVRDGHADRVLVLRDPRRRELGFVPLDPEASYRVGTTDFQAFVARDYRDLFAAGREPHKTELDLYDVLEQALAEGPVAAALDGRSGER